MWRHGAAAIGVLLVSLPMSAVLTLAMLPVWRWLEARYGIESVGHSGPADWCYAVMFVTCVLVVGSFYVVTVLRGRRESPVTSG